MNQNDSGTTKPTTVDAGGEKPSRLSIDEAIKYLFTSEKQALIRLVNSALGENHDLDETELIELHTEFINRKTAPDDEPDGESFNLEKIIADMIFSLNGTVYHIEFQTNADKTIAIRIMGYGTRYALRALRNKEAGGEVIFELPVPVLIQIDKDESLADKIPAKIKISGGEDALAFDITVIRLWEYGVDELVKRGYYLLLPFLLLRHRKGKKTDESARSLVEDIKRIEKAIAELYKNGLIYSNLRTNLYEVADGIAKNINEKYYDNNLEIDGELKKMGATRALYAQELVARGKAEITQVIRLFMQNKTAGEISKILGIPEQEVADILRETGLAGVSN